MKLSRSSEKSCFLFEQAASLLVSKQLALCCCERGAQRQLVVRYSGAYGPCAGGVLSNPFGPPMLSHGNRTSSMVAWGTGCSERRATAKQAFREPPPLERTANFCLLTPCLRWRRTSSSCARPPPQRSGARKRACGLRSWQLRITCSRRRATPRPLPRSWAGNRLLTRSR